MATPIPVNRCRFSAADVIRATGATFTGAQGMIFDGVGLDSRSIGPGNLFIALRGVRDGHEFLNAAAIVALRGRWSNVAAAIRYPMLRG